MAKDAIIYSYNKNINGFAAILDEEDASRIAGNTGPNPYSVLSTEPWVISVAASKTDRDFTNSVTLGDNKTLQGLSISMFGLSSHELYPLINASDATACDNEFSELAYVCENGSIDPKKIEGKIVVCVSGFDDETWVEQTKVVGVITLISVPNIDIAPANLMLPVSTLNYTNSKYILNYMNHTK
ncbi:unnamed protein product [Lupinus luteus]|uniref:Inhibitor I9 domain-containing protein n=1 Tax=Lupinus luteus TaxID=3873 RepID=A0AAV1XXA5_LUPLU